MADETSEPEEDETGTPSNSELASRVDGIESKLDTILAKLGGAEGQAHAVAQEHTEERLDRSSTVADDIAKALEERDRNQKESDWKTGVDTTLAQLTEKVPEPPVRKVEKIMGWRG